MPACCSPVQPCHCCRDRTKVPSFPIDLDRSPATVVHWSNTSIGRTSIHIRIPISVMVCCYHGGTGRSTSKRPGISRNTVNDHCCRGQRGYTRHRIGNGRFASNANFNYLSACRINISPGDQAVDRRASLSLNEQRLCQDEQEQRKISHFFRSFGCLIPGIFSKMMSGYIL